MFIRALVALLLPLVWVWARRQERAILQSGKPLREGELLDARRAGVQHPERVRVLVLPSVPPRLPRALRELAERCAWGPATVTGMALGYGIFVRAEQGSSRRLLVHELAHVAQYERLGVRPFLKLYLHQCLTSGYPHGLLEAEAKQIARDLLAPNPG